MTGTQERFRITGLTSLKRRPAAKRRLGRLGPDLGDDIRSLLTSEPFILFQREPGREMPSLQQGQLMTGHMVDDLGPGMSRGNR